MMTKRTNQTRNIALVPVSGNRAGFTLVEIMIVVMIIGLLASMALPGFSRAREVTQNTRTMNDLRVISAAFEMYAIEHGSWPADRLPGEFPPEMEGYLRPALFTEPTPIGGYFDWDPLTSGSKPPGVAVAVSIRNHGLTEARLNEFASRYGDGRIALLGDGSIFYVMDTE